MRLRAAFIAAIALLHGGLALAQEEADKARIDDFAVPNPNDETGLQIEQLGSGETKIAPAPSIGERTLEVENAVTTIAGGEAGAPVAQLSSAESDTSSEQLNRSEDDGNIADAAVSSTADSRPESIERLPGIDRCDPQSSEEETARCLAILELRAAEFSAAEPPRLSAEQVLLAEQLREPDVLARLSSNIQLRLAQNDPDADTRSNQELAAIVLSQDPLPDRPGAQDPEERLDDVSELVEAIRLGLPPPTTP